MKKNIFLLAIFQLLIMHSCATTQEDFLQANLYYQNHDYHKALDRYSTIEFKGPAIWYNMGNCWYFLNDYCNALVCWNKALQAGGLFLEDAIVYNCNHVYTEKLSLPLYQKSSWQSIKNNVNKQSLLFWQLLFLFFLWAFLTMLVAQLVKKYYYRSALLFKGILVTALCIAIKYQDNYAVYGLVKKPCAIYAGTDERFTQKGLLVAGYTVTILERAMQWSKISHEDKSGWILTENIEYI